MNDITDSSTISPHTVTPTSMLFSDKDENKTIKNIVNVRNEPVEFMDLPIELKQKIAFNLDGFSYANLHLTSKRMHHELTSLKEIPVKLKRCSGELKSSYEKMYIKSIRQMVRNEKKDDILQCLKRISIGKCCTSSNNISIATRYESNCTLPGKHWSGNILSHCGVEIMKLSNNRLIPGIMLRQENASSGLSTNRTVSLSFREKDLNDKTIELIFHAFNTIFNEESSNDRLLVALSAIKLRSYLCRKPPEGVDKNKIVMCTSNYPSLHAIGCIIFHYLIGK
ncbi:F-box protein [Klebsiella sp. BIGb0407]|uniref:F-box protein n=1 Tax=Klebsiella sp. BIGb0407 TaxID=2940603 RepID=UPI0021680638|nr:F-box protein [Klebsiella sp. BIGb0407]MCS3430906.1 hypothetical protein [Klebsiella sp. BIGb0407]